MQRVIDSGIPMEGQSVRINLDPPLLLRAEEAAHLLGLGRSTVFGLLASGELPAVRVGRSVRVSRAAVERFIAGREAPR